MITFHLTTFMDFKHENREHVAIGIMSIVYLQFHDSLVMTFWQILHFVLLFFGHDWFPQWRIY